MTTSERAPERATGLRERIREEEEWTIGALMRLYSLQEEDEQAFHRTAHQNSVGFNMIDANILTDMAKQYQQKGWLSTKQVNFIKGKLAKYVRQLESVGGVGPLPNARRKTTSVEAPVAELDEDGKTIIIQFPFSAAMKDNVKTLAGRRWNAEKKLWTAPICLESVELLVDWKFSLGERLSAWYKKMLAPLEEDVEVPGLLMELFPFQKKGVAFIESRDGRALVGDEMGLGKTIQALAYLQLHPEHRPAVVVCPASLKLNWEKEIHRAMPDVQTLILSGRYQKDKYQKPAKKGTNEQNRIFIINYDILESWREPLEGLAQPKVIILDECHYIKNSKAKRTKAARTLCKKTPHVLCLSGTPITNRPQEMFTAINIIRQDLFPSFWKYAMRYCGAKHNGFGWDFTGATNTEELHKRLTRTIMVRRKKEDVLKDLPPKMRSVVPMPLENQEEYRKAENHFIDWLRGIDPKKASKAERAQALAEIEALKQLAVAGKIEAVKGWIQDHLESNGKLVVFTTHHKTIDYLSEALSDFSPVTLDGRTPLKARDEAITAFQTDPGVRVFLGNVKAAGVGITLTAASSVCFAEMGWTPGEHDQAEDRIHRIGQEADSINAYYLICPDTIEARIASLLDKKRAVLDMVLDGKETKDEAMLTELLKDMREGNE